jgi:purine-nucleoside phosphorylase
MFEKAAALLQKRGLRPHAAVILGSGMGGVLAGLKNSVRIPYAKIPGFPRAGVKGHTGVLECGLLGGVPVAVFRGRFHLYEGFDAAACAAPVFAAHAMGARFVLQTSAAGGLNPRLRAGKFMLVRDHFEWRRPDVLASLATKERRVDFLDVTRPYDEKLRAAAEKAARRLRMPLAGGVLAVTHGPCYETPAEARALRRLGADAVCMSGAPEAVFARYLDMPLAGLLVITNALPGRAISHAEVLKRARASEKRLDKFMREWMAEAARGGF